MPISHEDIARIGRQIYKERIIGTLNESQTGKFVVIDVYSGDYEIADDDVTASAKLFSRKPDAMTWAERVGFPTPYRMGFGYRPASR